MLELRTLGSLAAITTTPEGVRQLARGKPVALLAFLSAAPGRRASRERLATLLWSDGSSEQARQNLRQAIWYIRRRLGAVLEASDDFIVVPTDCASDRDSFLTAVREQRLADAVGLYSGDFIPDFAAPGAAEFEQWCDVERRRLRALFLGCADTLARQALGKGQAATAVILARRARDAAPLEFAPWRLLLESLIAARDPVTALAEAESLEALLAAHELEADDGTRAAIRSARNASNAGRSVGAASSGTSAADEHASFAPELIGREREFSAVLERWEQAKAGRGSAVLVTGVAGLGKSRLLADLHARLRAGRSRALLIRANPGDRSVAGGFAAALAESVAQRPGSAGISAESAGVLVALAPALASVYTQATPDRSSGEDALRRRVSAMLELLRSISDDAAFALLVDDLHWVDEESRRMLDAVAARLEAGRTLLVLATRPPLESLGGFMGLPRVELARLDLQRVAEFVTRLGELPLDEWAANLPAHLASSTRGIPLSIIEALQRLIEEGTLALQDQRWSSPAPGRLFEVLRDGAALENRVRSLSAGPRELLLLLATLGRPTQARSIGADSRLTELEQRGFVARVGDELHVMHDEVSDAAMAVATESERQTAHTRAAEIVAAESSSDSALIIAARHAARGQSTQLLRRLGRLWVESKRAAGRDDSSQVLITELLGADAAGETRTLALSGVRWMQRPARKLLRAAAGIALAIATLGGWTALNAGREPDVEFLVQLDGESGRYARISIPDMTRWNRDEPVVAELINPRELPAFLKTEQRISVAALPDGSGWVGNAFFSDSSGDEVVLIDAASEVSRPTLAAGDDNGVAPSPDGQQFAFATARWNRSTDRYQIAIYDRATRSTRRVTFSSDYDANPKWSPDGSRLAFMRNPFTKVGPLQLCVIHVDGGVERCDWPGLEESVNVRGWVDDSHVLLEEPYTGRNFVYSLETHEKVAAASGQVWDAQDARVLLLSSRANGEGLVVSRPDLRGAERRVLLDGRPLVGTPRVLQGSLARRHRFVDSLALSLPPGGLPVDLTHRLLVEAFDSAGRQLPARALRIRSLDSTVASVDGEILRPKRTGAVQLELSVGGWRSDTVTLRIVPSTVTTVLSEGWERGFGTRWRPFGDPAATTGRTSRYATLRPNGDGKYESGVYLVDTLSLDDGIGFEADVSIPVTRLQWQSLSLGFHITVPRALFAAWDHRSGNVPPGDRQLCAAVFGGEGGSGFTHYFLVGPNTEMVRQPAAPELFNGAWHRVRLQYFPDGRCGMALDGEPVMLTVGRTRFSGDAMLRIRGHSYETNVQVGPLELWKGVRGGIDWSKLDSR